MQHAHAVETCRVCGKESKTVICMHCFLNYNYKMYAKPGEDSDEAVSRINPLSSRQREEEAYWTREREKLNEQDSEDESFSFGSIFSRIPRFD